MVKPFLKWAGGKRQILNYIIPYIEKNLDKNSKYFEPFLGGGSVFFKLNRDNCVINDLNKEVINCYKVIKSNPKELIKLLKEYQKNHNESFYYQIRGIDRNLEEYSRLSPVEKAARTIYLNKTCYNGLYRVNMKGHFNTPVGRYVNPKILDEENILEINNFLNNSNNIKIKSTSFELAVKDAKKGDFIYFDPPYDYEDKGFTKYIKEGFEYSDLQRLKKVCDKLINKGCKVLISNNATERVLKLFDHKNYNIVAITNESIVYDHEFINVKRYVGSSKNSRKSVKEVLIYGHK